MARASIHWGDLVPLLGERTEPEARNSITWLVISSLVTEGRPSVLGRSLRLLPPSSLGKRVFPAHRSSPMPVYCLTSGTAGQRSLRSLSSPRRR